MSFHPVEVASDDLVEAIEVPTENRLNFSGCEIYFLSLCPSQISKMKSMKVILVE